MVGHGNQGWLSWSVILVDGAAVVMVFTVVVMVMVVKVTVG